MATVGKAPQRDRKQAVDQSKGQTCKQADLGIGNVKFGLDRFNHNAHDLTVDQADRRNQEQHKQGVMTAKSGDLVIHHFNPIEQCSSVEWLTAVRVDQPRGLPVRVARPIGTTGLRGTSLH